MQGDGEEEETDNLVNEVLDEIGINLDEQMVAAPGQKAQVTMNRELLFRIVLHIFGHILLAEYA